MDIPAKLADLEGQMVFSKNIMDKQDDDHRRFAERVNENHNTMNTNIQILKEDMTHTKETLDNVNNTLQALLRQRHHSRSSRSSRTHSSRPRDDHQGQEDGQAPDAQGQGPHQPEQEGQGESQGDPLLAQVRLHQQ